MMRRLGEILLGLLILAAGPALVIGGLWAWAGRASVPDAAAPLSVHTEHSLAWINEPVPLLTRFRPTPAAGNAQPVDLLLVIDTSGSTVQLQPMLTAALQQTALSLLLSGVPGNRVALVSFATTAQVVTGWTPSPDVFVAGLSSLPDLGGGTSGIAGMAAADSLLATANPASRRVVVVFTDGEFGPGDWPVVGANATAARQSGVEFYAVGVPGSLNPAMEAITGDKGRLLSTASPADLLQQFRSAALGKAGVLADRGALSLRPDGRLFSVTVFEPGWAVGPDGVVLRDIRPVANAVSIFVHRQTPLVHGLVPALSADTRLRYFDGTAFVERMAATPYFLVLSPAFLLIAFAPALAWALWMLLQPRAKIRAEPDVIPVDPPPLAMDVLRLPAPVTTPQPLVPTVFIGLGGWGAQAVRQTQRMLADLTSAGTASIDAAFQIIDLDGAQAQEGGLSPAVLTAPPAVTNAYTYLHDLPIGAQYRNAGRQELTLSNGAHGDRQLGRAAFLHWLSAGGLLEGLEAHIDWLMANGAPGRVRQIVVFAGASGGFGGAIALDVARIARRLVRDRQNPAGFIPEIIGIVGIGGPSGDEAAAALVSEIETTRTFARFPVRSALAAGHPVLDREDREAPFDTVFTVHGATGAAEAASLSAVLADPVPRRELLVNALGSGAPVAAVQAVTAGLSGSRVRALVAEEFLVRFIGSHVLGGLIAAPDGGFRLPPVDETGLARALAAWADAEPAGTPWRYLLDMTARPDYRPDYAAAEATGSEDPLERLTRQAARSLTSALAASPETDGARGMSVAQAQAALAYTARALRARVIPDLAASGVAAPATEAIAALAGRLEALERLIAAWTGELIEAVAVHAGQRRALAADLAGDKGGVALLDRETTDEAIAGWLDQALLAWTGSAKRADATSGSRLSLAIGAEGDDLVPILRCHLGERADFRQTVEAVEALGRIAGRVASLVPPFDIENALARLAEEELAAHARRLSPVTGPAEGAMIVRPAGNGPGVRRFLAAIREPAGMPERLEAVGLDRSAIRRIAWGAERIRMQDRPLPVVQSIDVAAALFARRVAAHIEMDDRPLPAEMRVAASRPQTLAVFAMAYRQGCLRLQPDQLGRSSWVLLPEGRFLTDGDDRLVAAIAAFTALDLDPAMPWPFCEPGGSFTLLDRWRRERGPIGAREEDELFALGALDLVAKESVR